MTYIPISPDADELEAYEQELAEVYADDDGPDELEQMREAHRGAVEIVKFGNVLSLEDAAALGRWSIEEAQELGVARLADLLLEYRADN